MEIQDLSIGHAEPPYLKTEPKIENVDFSPPNTYHTQIPQNLALDGRLGHFTPDGHEHRHFGLNGRVDDGRFDPRLGNSRDSSEDTFKSESLEDPYSFVEEDGMLPRPVNGCYPPPYNHPEMSPHLHTLMQGPKKRGRKKKIPDMIGTVDELGMPISSPQDLPAGKRKYTKSENYKQRRRHDRFNGMSEEEVKTRTLPDHLLPNLDIVVIGINPGLFAAYKGHHYAGPGNHFWKCMYLAGLVPEPMTAEDDFKLIQFGIGFTNMVCRATKGSADLTRREIREGGRLLLEKLQRYQPKIAVFNGKGIYEVFSGKKEFSFGKQPEFIDGTSTYIWVMPSSSARCAQLPRAMDKVPFYTALKKFRDYLNGLVPSIDDSEVVFPETRFPIGDESVDFSDLKDDADLVPYSGEDPQLGIVKKKRGRPKKIRGEEGFPFKAEGPTDLQGLPPPGGQPLDYSIMSDGAPRKKRGRPKKIRPEETGMISATPTRRPPMPHETHALQPVNDNYLHYYNQQDDMRPIGHFALPPPLRSPSSANFGPHFGSPPGFPSHGYQQNQAFGPPSNHSPPQNPYPQGPNFVPQGHQNSPENHYPQGFPPQNNHSPYPQNYAQQASFSPSCGSQPINFSQSPAQAVSHSYHHSPQGYSHTPSPAATPQSSTSGQFPNYTQNDLSTDISAAMGGGSLSSPPPKTSPSREFEPQENPQEESSSSNTTVKAEVKDEPSEVKSEFYPQEGAFHEFGFKQQQEVFPPKPASSQDLAAKSLHGLESLVDQIPNLGEPDPNHQQYPPSALQQHYEGQYAGYNYGEKSSFNYQPGYPGFNYPRYPQDQQYAYPPYMGRSPYQGAEPGYGSYGGQFGVPPAPYGSPAAGSVPYPPEYSAGYPYHYSNSPYQQSASPTVVDKAKQEPMNFTGF